jgi:hypothetical protein
MVAIAVLLEHFLTLLRATGNHVILAETSNTWKKIKAHHRLHNYMNIPLPWTLNEILRDLETSNITTLHMPSNSHEHNLPTPVVFKAMNNKYGHHQRLPTNHPNLQTILIIENTNHHQWLPLKNKTSVFFATTNIPTLGILQNSVHLKIHP